MAYFINEPDASYETIWNGKFDDNNLTIKKKSRNAANVCLKVYEKRGTWGPCIDYRNKRIHLLIIIPKFPNNALRSFIHESLKTVGTNVPIEPGYLNSLTSSKSRTASDHAPIAATVLV